MRTEILRRDAASAAILHLAAAGGLTGVRIDEDYKTV
jgi:hypothetical protein